VNAGWQEKHSTCHFGHTCYRFVSLELDGSELQLPPKCTMAKCSNYTLVASVTGQSACIGQIIHLCLKLSMFRAVDSAKFSIATSAVTSIQEQILNNKTDTFNTDFFFFCIWKTRSTTIRKNSSKYIYIFHHVIYWTHVFWFHTCTSV
jgi:hypothetical protein